MKEEVERGEAKENGKWDKEMRKEVGRGTIKVKGNKEK